MLKKKTIRMISCVVAGVLVVAMVVSLLASGLIFAGAANDADELKDKLSQLEDEKASVKQKIAELTEQAADVEAIRAALVSEIDTTKKEIETVEAYIDRLQEQIDVKTSELAVAEKQLEQKQEEFDECVRTTYEQGDTTYLQILLNSSSFSNMLKRMEIISQLMDHSKSVVAEYTAAKEDIEQKRSDLQDTQDEQKEYQKTLSYKADELEANEAQQAALLESLEAYKAESEAEYNRITDEMNAVSNEIAELSRQSAASGSTPMGDGTLIWPLPGYSANSAYGWRIHPIYGTRKFHAGEDIAAPGGTPILAAAAGTVTTAGWVSGYGNYTVINHGGGMVTAYGHQSRLGVSVGQTVAQGDVIGYVGTTGNSTGNHLHFEVYINGATVDPKSYF